MFQKMNPAITENIISGIITFRELSAGLKTVKVDGSDQLNTEVLGEFEEQLRMILTDVFDTTKPFVQTAEQDNCMYCAFKGICNR
jgi:hypothetical protein